MTDTVDHERIRREAEDVIAWQRGPAKRTAEAFLALLNERPTVDACIIAALETKLEETERELALAIERAADAEALLATAHDALHDCGFLRTARP